MVFFMIKLTQNGKSKGKRQFKFSSVLQGQSYHAEEDRLFSTDDFMITKLFQTVI